MVSSRCESVEMVHTMKLSAATLSAGPGRPKKERMVEPEDTPVLETLKGGWGTLHVCDHAACTLPREEFWKAAKEAAVEHSPAMVPLGRGSSNNAGREP